MRRISDIIGREHGRGLIPNQHAVVQLGANTRRFVSGASCVGGEALSGFAYKTDAPQSALSGAEGLNPPKAAETNLLQLRPLSGSYRVHV